MPSPPVPQEGQRPYRTPFSGRRFASDLAQSAFIPPVLRLGDRFAGNPIRNLSDRLFGAGNDRATQDYNNYMRQMMNQDSRAYGGNSISDWFRRTFGGGDQQQQPEGAQTFPYQDSWQATNAPPTPRFNEQGRNAISDSYFSGPLNQGPRNRIGAGRGTTIAEGAAAQGMFGGMRDSANAANMQQQARNAMANMFRGSEY